MGNNFGIVLKVIFLLKDILIMLINFNNVKHFSLHLLLHIVSYCLIRTIKTT